MSTGSNRSASPLVFVRHPHSFVPVSGQNIPPPPNWKPPPLPKDIDDSGTEKSYQSSTNSRKTESVSSDGGYLSIPTVQSSDTFILDTPSRSNSTIPPSICLKPMQESKDSPNIHRIDNAVTKTTLPENKIKSCETEENSSLIIDVGGSPESESVGVVSPDKNEGESKSVTGNDVPDIKIDNLHTTGKNHKLNTERVHESDSKLDASSCQLSHPDFMADTKKDDDPSLTVVHDADSKNISDGNTVSTELTTKSSGKLEKSKAKKGHKNQFKSIVISKLEEELDSLPIPEFPSLGLEEELDTLPMSEFPAPEVSNNKQPENFTPSNTKLE
jgi:hypothetical protein